MFPLQPRGIGIHGQILLIAIAPALIVTLILVLVVYEETILQGNQVLAQQGQLLAAQLAATLEYALSTGAVDQLPATIESAVKPAAGVLRTPVRRVDVFDKDNQRVYTTPPDANPPVVEVESFLPWLVSTEARQVFTAPIQLDPLALSAASKDKRYLGKVSIEMATALVKTEQLNHFLLDTGLVLITFATVLGLAHWIGQRLSGAIRAAAQAILRIKGGDLAVRLPQTETNEIGTLQEGVNLLAETIASAQEHLETELARVRGEYHQALEELRAQSLEAQRANQAKSTFLATVSHEMRTPLYSIQGLVEQLLKSQHATDEERSLHTILTAADSLYRTIDDILDFTQLEKGKYTSLITPVELWTEIENVTETVGPLATRAGLYLDIIIDPSVPQTVLGDGKAFRTIVANLVANAVKFTEQGGICVRLRVDALQPDWSRNRIVNVRLQVADTGRGILEHQRQTIFEPFEQADGALNRRYAGTGLGLSIVKEYCDQLGGRVNIESQPGQGSVFTVVLPFKIAYADTQPVCQAPASDLVGVRVLVAAERATFRESVHCRLASLGASVSEQAVTPQTLAAMTPPAQRYDLLVVQDLFLLAVETVPALTERLGLWARHIASLNTRSDTLASPQLREAGITFAFWCGATRQMLQDELKALGCNDPRAPVMTQDSDKLREDLVGKTVLVVEDFDINRYIMTRQLQDKGLHVIEACDGHQAVALATQRGIDLILMDIQMPGKDGITAIREIRALPAYANLPIVGFTASADKPTHDRIMATGANAVLTKPISEDGLVATIHAVLMTAASSTTSSPSRYRDA